MAKLTSRPEGLQRIGSTVSKDQPITISPIDAVDIDRGLFVLRGLVAGEGIEIELLDVDPNNSDFGDVIRITATGGGTGPVTPASRWLNGSGAPASSLGVNGDYYINTANGEYFSKNANAWVLLGDLTGPAGANGTDGTDGTDGEDGDSAYEVAIANGFVGTQAAWLLSLKGTNGTNGTNGTDGTDGVDGEGVPVGGTAGQILAKNGVADFDTVWIDAPTSGSGGITSVSSTDSATVDFSGLGTSATPLTAVVKISNTANNALTSDSAGLFVATGGAGVDGDSAYEIAVANGFVGTEVQWLASLNGTDGVDGEGVPVGGTAGQVLAKVDGVDFNTAWVDASAGGDSLPVGGTTGQVLAKASNTDGDAEWVDAGSSVPLVTQRIRFRVELSGTDLGAVSEVPAGITVVREDEYGLRITHNFGRWAFLMTTYAYTVNGYVTRLQQNNQTLANVSLNQVFIPAITPGSNGATSGTHFYIELFF